MVKLSTSRTGRLYPQEMFLVLIFTRVWVYPRAMVRLEGNMSLKNPVTPTGIGPGTVRLVAQGINHYATTGPNRNKYQKYFLESKVGRCVGLTNLPSKHTDCLEIGSLNLLELPGPVQLLQGLLYIYLLSVWLESRTSILGKGKNASSLQFHSGSRTHPTDFSMRTGSL